MANHLTNDPPNDDSREKWLEEDAHLFLQIHNSIENEVLSLVNHYKYVKESMDYLEFQFSEKGNISRSFMFVKPFIIQKSKISLSCPTL